MYKWFFIKGGKHKECKTLMLIYRNGTPIGLLTAKDAERKEMGRTFEELHSLGFNQIELLTGDHHQMAKLLAQNLHSHPAVFLISPSF